MSSSGSKARWPWVLAAATALAGLALTFLLWSIVAEGERQEAIDAFRQEAETIHRYFERDIALFMDVLDSIRVLHTLSGQISQEALDEFVEKGMLHQRRVLGEFGFAQRISHDVREALERAYRASPEEGYLIREYDEEEGRLRPAGIRPEYYPLTWQTRDEALGGPVGYDLASFPAARRAIERMRMHGRTVLADTPAQPAETEHDAYLVFAPILYGPADPEAFRPGYLIGFAAALWEPRAVIERVMTAVPFPHMRIAMQPGATDVGPPRIAPFNDLYRYEASLIVADTAWHLICATEALPVPRRAAIVLASGLLITALVTSQLLIIAGRTRRIEGEVRRRTAELRDAAARLETEMIERMRLESEIQDAGTRERRKLGHGLHDSLGQKLTGAVYLSRSLVDHLKEQGDAEQEHARKLNEILKTAVAQVRGMARGLSPVTLGGENLGEALTQMAGEVTDLYNVPCEVDIKGDSSDLDARTTEQLYLIAQEAVNNAARHAEAESIHVVLERADGGWKLVVEDDGKGMTPGAEAGEGMGLRIMNLRARTIGGELIVEPNTPRGTRIACRVSDSPPN